MVCSQMRWSGHVVRMEDSRPPKHLFYSQLKIGDRNHVNLLERFPASELHLKNPKHRVANVHTGHRCP